eukprot:gnl/MRDRNA2_/MRDRNA2_92535_c0_seq1.p1 gnl/MRDRNA2_/MRDRNA2_92535_c0~~gnl/MRDRNA2_/MRDRNA2_92535_c0_seq1.p1  ORF type:complete len:575 (-),score=185.39 gnl/MRDRNA2_/MRDRNA2_92535_c0_seq1:61-1785(-)
MMISGPTKVALMLLTVAVFGAEVPKHVEEEEGDSLPSVPGEWDHEDYQEEMPMKGQKRPVVKPMKVHEKKAEILIQKHDDDDADEDDIKKGAPAPAPVLNDVINDHSLQASQEDDSDHPKKAPSRHQAPVSFAQLLGKELLFASMEKDKDTKQMNEKEFEQYAVESTKPLMDSLHSMMDTYMGHYKKEADKDPESKWYLELFEPMTFAQLYPEEHKQKMAEREQARLDMVKAEEERKKKAAEKKDMDLLKKEVDKFSAQSKQVENLFAKLKAEFDTLYDEDNDELLGQAKKGMQKIKGVVDHNAAMQKALAHLLPGDGSCAEARKETQNNKYESTIWDEVQERPAKKAESEEDVEAAHKELIKKESAPKKEHGPGSTVRSNMAVRVDANGEMVQMKMQEPEPKELSQKPSVRQADDTNSHDRNSVKATPDADDKLAHSTAKPRSAFDDDYTTPEDKQRQEDDAKRSSYLGVAGLLVVVILIGWLLIRHRAQQMIDRSTAFDDASSVSSSTVTEENPTVKVNRALLERMANISQKLSEKVEEVRASSNADSNSSGGSAARQYTRKKQKDPLLGSA